MRRLLQTAQSNLGTLEGSFLYTILPVKATEPRQFVVDSSEDDHLRLFSVSNKGRSIQLLDSVNLSSPISCFNLYDESRGFVTASRHGAVRFTGVKSPIAEVKTPNEQGVSALVCSSDQKIVAVGTDLEGNGPGDVGIYVWSVQSSGLDLIRQYTDSHTDTITLLQFVPQSSLPRLSATDISPASNNSTVRLLTASTDGLINIIDPSIEDEDDAVEAVFNNKAGVQHVCITTATQSQAVSFLYAVSHDEQLSRFRVEEAGRETESAPVTIDAREAFKCDYAISLKTDLAVGADGRGVLLSTGSYKTETTEVPNVCIWHIRPDPDGSEKVELLMRLEGAHGEEIVRDIFYSATCAYVVTVGEDGHARVWSESADRGSADTGISQAQVAMDVEPTGEESRSKKERRKGKKSKGGHDERFNPY